MLPGEEAPQDDGSAKRGVTINNLIEDSSMCLLLLSLWLCVVGVMLRNLYEECRVERRFSQAGFLFTCLLIGIGGGYGCALAFNSYDERVDLVYIGYVTIAGYTVTLVAMLLIMLEFVWWKVWHAGDWIPQDADDDEVVTHGHSQPSTPRQGKFLGKSGSFNMAWVTDWLRGGPQPDREYKDYKPMREGVELTTREQRGLQPSGHESP